MTKSQLIQEMLKRSNILTKQDAGRTLNVLLSSMTEALVRGEKIEIRDFGNFRVRTYQSYQGRNPRTGVKVEVAPKRLPHFKVGKELKKLVDNPKSG